MDALERVNDFKQRSVSNMNRRQHPQRLTIYNRSLRNITTLDVNTTGGGGGERLESSKRGRHKNSGSKRSSVGARMSKGGNGSAMADSAKHLKDELRRVPYVNLLKHLDAGASSFDEQECPESFSTAKGSMSFGPTIPDDVLDDICFRFLINIPEDQKNAPVRICFQIELAHWFYTDFYCKGNYAGVKCPDVSLRDFIGQIFCHCDFLVQHTDNVDKILEEWRDYKSAVPTYGAALLDNSLNYVLLVQGYFAKNSWGFPKGKVNQEEDPMDCASREVWEEVGFDISDRICKTRLIQSFVNDTLIRLYIICDVPTDFPFAPNTRNEIGRIQWFSVWDLPKDRSDVVTCERIGMSPNCFYTVIPFVKELQAYVTRHQNMQNKPKQKARDLINIGARSSSAFSPVQPHQKNEALAPALSPLFTSIRNASTRNRTTASAQNPHHASPDSAFFKPLTTSSEQVSYTGTAFVQMLSVGASCTSIEERLKMKEVTRPVPTVPKTAMPVLGRPIYDAFKEEAKEKKVMATASEPSVNAWRPDVGHNLISDIEETAKQRVIGQKLKKNAEHSSWSHLQTKAETSLPEYHISRNVLVNDTANGNAEEKPIIDLCEAWKNFKFDVSRLF